MKRIGYIHKVFIILILLTSTVPFSFSQKETNDTNDTLFADFSECLFLNNSSIGILVQEIKGGTIAEQNKNKSLTPASILKLVTTATALEALGEDFSYKTSLSFEESKITISGSGDPTLGSEYLFQNPKAFLAEWAQEISKLKTNQAIELYIEDNRFGYSGISRKWLREDIGNYYAAGAYGLSVFDNTYKLSLNTMDVQPKILGTEPEMKKIVFRNTLKYNNTGQDNGYILGEPFSQTRQLIGDIPAKRNSFSIKGDIPDPGLYLGEVLAQALAAKGIAVDKLKTAREDYYSQMYSTTNSNKKTEKTAFYTHQSPTLKDIIRVVNVRSNNHYAEHLIRTMGRNRNNDIYTDPLNEGIESIASFWKNKSLDTNALFMYDGCGLSPSNAISPEFICDILRYMYNDSKNAEAFVASFPKAGLEGTVRNFLEGSRLAGKVYVKSGSIANVQSYAGYYIDGEKIYVFTIIVNNFKSEVRKDVVKAIESFLLNTLP